MEVDMDSTPMAARTPAARDALAQHEMLVDDADADWAKHCGSLVHDMFRGQLEVRIQCGCCGKLSVPKCVVP